MNVGLAVVLPLLFQVAPGVDDAPLPTEATYYRIVDLVAPEDIVLEVGGFHVAEGGVILVATRRGDIWRIEDAYGDAPVFSLWADGLQEPLGLEAYDGWIYVVTRGELVRLRDEDGDHRADRYETVCDDWVISGNYHEYAFGPRRDSDGNFWVTLNKPFGDEPFGKVDWRGWAVRITPEGKMEPACSGLRSPCGVEIAPWGDVFYTDNQGEWCPTNKLAHLEVGDFHGHPHGIESCKRPESLAPFPGEIPDGMLIPEVAKLIPSLKLPAVWFPYDKMGKSASGMAWDQTGARFGPFYGQCFVGDQHDASVMRVHLEKVGGAWQGACFPFREGFGCGITRVEWGEDASLLVGMTNRGWGSLGNRSYGIQRLVWTGETPTEIQTMTALPGGFRLTFTRPMNIETLAFPQNYTLESYTFRLHEQYGSPEFDRAQVMIAAARPADDGLSVDLSCIGLREGYVHELRAERIRSADGLPLLHPDAYYTLNARPTDDSAR